MQRLEHYGFASPFVGVLVMIAVCLWLPWAVWAKVAGTVATFVTCGLLDILARRVAHRQVRCWAEAQGMSQVR